MKKNFQNPYKERNLTFPVLIVITVISAALILLSFSIFITEPKQELCDFSITYNDKSYDIKAATKLLSLEVSKTNSAVEHVSNLLKIYFDQTNKLCKHYRDGVMTSDEYREDLQKIGERFALLVNFQSQSPATKISDSQLPLYSESLELLQPEVEIKNINFEFQIISDSRILKNGAILKSGDKYHIELFFPEEQYVYIVLLDSQDLTYRLYPTQLTGQENPVKGKLRIPSNYNLNFELDKNTGIEHILIFTQFTRSEALERQLPSITNTTQFISSNNSQLLKQAVQTRGSFVSTTQPESAESGPEHVISTFGQAAVEFIIDHR